LRNRWGAARPGKIREPFHQFFGAVIFEADGQLAVFVGASTWMIMPVRKWMADTLADQRLAWPPGRTRDEPEGREARGARALGGGGEDWRARRKKASGTCEDSKSGS